MNADLKRPPEILVLTAITPTPASSRSDRLLYEKLEPIVHGTFEKNDDSDSKYWVHGAASKHYEKARMDAFWDAESESIEEEEAARELAQQYLLLGAWALNKAQRSDAQATWSTRYTEASSELYGTPNASIAEQLYNARNSGMEALHEYESASKAVKEYLDDVYCDVFTAMQLDSRISKLSPQQVATTFEAGISVLARDFDPDWNDWKIDRNEDKDSLSVIASKKSIVVGLKRAEMDVSELKAKFSHEVLVHAQRAINGAKIAPKLATGLPGYLDAEEGLGAFVEYAVKGRLSEVFVDRYVDVAFALGILEPQANDQVTGRTRKDLIELTLNRAKVRNELSESPMSEESLLKAVYAHVNRIYRGSLGNEHVGVFTKDASYYTGFVSNAQYITSELAAGRPIRAIMEHLLSGKFDPTNAKHVEFLKSQ